MSKRAAEIVWSMAGFCTSASLLCLVSVRACKSLSGFYCQERHAPYETKDAVQATVYLSCEWISTTHNTIARFLRDHGRKLRLEWNCAFFRQESVASKTPQKKPTRWCLFNCAFDRTSMCDARLKLSVISPAAAIVHHTHDLNAGLWTLTV